MSYNCQKNQDRSTSAAKKHLYTHPDYVAAQGAAAAADQGAMDTFVVKNAGFMDSYVKWCVIGHQPLNTCEDEYFRAMLDSIGANVQHLNRAGVTARLKEIHAFVHAHLPAVFKGQDVCVTLDGWKSRANESYQCTTLHWINEYWKICSAVASVRRFTGEMRHLLYRAESFSLFAAKLLRLALHYRFLLSSCCREAHCSSHHRGARELTQRRRRRQ
jgi:hypothetical protein